MNIMEANEAKYDKDIILIENILNDICLQENTNKIQIPIFILLVKKKTKFKVEIIKIRIIQLVMRNLEKYYLERISEYYTDQRKHYILCDGFIRGTILIRNNKN